MCKPQTHLNLRELAALPIEAVIFDLDGTLAAFNLDYKALRGEVREYLIHVGVPASVLKPNESIFDMMQKTEIYFKNSSKNGEAFTAIRAQCLVIAEKYEMEAATTTTLLTGAVETLKELQKMKLKIGLCTTSSEKAVNYILNRFKIQEYFQVVVPRDKVKNVKPDPEQFMLALKTLGVRPNAAVIVGDSKVDMQSAKELKTIAVGLPAGVSTTEQLMESGAHYIITTLIDLPVLVKKLDKA
ncbi:MAG: HAD family phosphatase [Candidatus Bathyarchaeota archaeon]|nr:HAD family phosphatase [Candidatus Bathyarchaeota archaeon]